MNNPFDALPEALRAAMGRDCALVVHWDELEDRRYEIFEARPEPGGVVVSRRCWWFDEDAAQWVLDETSEWYLTREQAQQLGLAIQQAGMPTVRSSFG